MFKRFSEYVLIGAGTCIGSFIMMKGFETISDPCKKAKLRKKISKIKSVIKEKS